MELYNCQNCERDILSAHTRCAESCPAFSLSHVLKDLTMETFTLSDLLSQIFAQN